MALLAGICYTQAINLSVFGDFKPFWARSTHILYTNTLEHGTAGPDHRQLGNNFPEAHNIPWPRRLGIDRFERFLIGVGTFTEKSFPTVH